MTVLKRFFQLHEVDPALGVPPAELRRIRRKIAPRHETLRQKLVLRRMSWLMREPSVLYRTTTWGDEICLLAPLLVVVGPMVVISQVKTLPDTVWYALPAVALVAYLWRCWFWRRHLACRFYLRLRERGYELCARCGHVMKGMAPDATCPECGFEHHDAPVGKRLGWPDKPSLPPP